MICKKDNCELETKVKGFCRKHYLSYWQSQQSETWKKRQRELYRIRYSKDPERFKRKREVQAQKYLEKYGVRYPKEWQQNNKEIYNSKESRRRTKKHNNGVFVILKKEIKRLYASPCFYCGSTNKIQIDHIIPISRGGRHSVGNILPACQKCNASKSNRFLVDWKHKNG